MTAPNNGTPWYKNTCVTSALKSGAINAGIDAIGFLPEAGGVARVVGPPCLQGGKQRLLAATESTLTMELCSWDPR